MPIRFAAPGGLRPGQRPTEVAPPTRSGSAGHLLTPMDNEVPGLMQVVGDNLHMQGTPVRPGFSAQMPPLSRPVDPSDLEAVGSVGDPYKLGAMANRAEVRTQTADSPSQAMDRISQMGSDRSGQQLQTEIHGAQSLVNAVAQPQMVQQNLGRERVAQQQLAQATGRDGTSDFANAQAHEFAARARQAVMSPEQLAALDTLASRMASPSLLF